MVFLCLPRLGILQATLVISLTACASSPVAIAPTPASRPAQDPPMMASLKPVEPTAPVRVPLDRVASAASLLDQGIRFLGAGDFAEAAYAFDMAIATGRLNNAGRVFAYWQIFVANEELGNIDHSSDALSSFLVVADEVLTERDRLRYAVTATGDFVERFELKTKLRRARASLSAAWANRAEHFGRSVDQPVPVHDLSEMEQFLTMVAACEGARREKRAHREIRNAAGERIRQVTITCGGFDPRAEYFFALIPVAP